MNSIVVHYKELALKGQNRPWFIQHLVRNLRFALQDLDVIAVRSLMGRIDIELGHGRLNASTAARLWPACFRPDIGAPDRFNQLNGCFRWQALASGTGKIEVGFDGCAEDPLSSEQIGNLLLQPVDRWVFAVLVVADRRRSHSLAHPRRRQGHGVRTKVDTVHGGPDCFTIREFRV